MIPTFTDFLYWLAVIDPLTLGEICVGFGLDKGSAMLMHIVICDNLRQTTKPVVLPAAGPGQKPVYVPRGTTYVFDIFLMLRVDFFLIGCFLFSSLPFPSFL